MSFAVHERPHCENAGAGVPPSVLWHPNGGGFWLLPSPPQRVARLSTSRRTARKVANAELRSSIAKG
jgi:hypothetical protein